MESPARRPSPRNPPPGRGLNGRRSDVPPPTRGRPSPPGPRRASAPLSPLSMSSPTSPVLSSGPPAARPSQAATRQPPSRPSAPVMNGKANSRDQGTLDGTMDTPTRMAAGQRSATWPSPPNGVHAGPYMPQLNISSFSPTASEGTHTPAKTGRNAPSTFDSPSLAPPSEAFSFEPSSPRSLWATTTDADDDEMITEVDGDAPDDEFIHALQGVGSMHTRKLLRYKRLLEQSQHSTASQLHALQAEVRMLREALAREQRERTRIENEVDRVRSYAQPRIRTPRPAITDMTAIIRGSIDGTISDGEVKAALRALRPAERTRLIHHILESCLPGDISAMIRLLEKYLASTFDVLGNLPEELAVRILCDLSVQELLSVATVSHTWSNLVHHPLIWRYHCMRISATDPIPPRPPARPDGWEPMYRGLHYRERNWSDGLAQSMTYLKGHTGFVTTLLLKGKRLISGSYDETIRIWDLETGTEKKALQVKAVSCLDFLTDEEIFAAGFHDIGRVQVFSSVTWTVLQTLQGHLYGIRALAMNSKWLVSAGADKALVCWDWRMGTKIVRFGQQTNLNIGVQLVDDDRVASITVDGVVRTFSIPRREMLSQFKLSDLEHGNPAVATRILGVGTGANMLQWFAAKGNQITCATKSLIIRLEWTEQALSERTSSGSAGPSTPTSATLPSPLVTKRKPSNPKAGGTATPSREMLDRPSPSRSSISRVPLSRSASGATPRVLSVIETPDMSIGAVDTTKGRVITSTRFARNMQTERRIFVSTCRTTAQTGTKSESFGTDSDQGISQSRGTAEVPVPDKIVPITGVWDQDPGLAMPERNPMSMALSHEDACIGCADGTIYVLSFVGHNFLSAE